MTVSAFMNVSRQFQLISQKLLDQNADIRHTILDIWPEFNKATAQKEDFPKYLQEEVYQLRNEMELVQPKFPSHRKTSLLFDQEGMGQKGRTRATDIARRILSVSRRLEKAE